MLTEEQAKYLLKHDREIKIPTLINEFIEYTFKNYIKLKDLVSEFVWYILVGYLTITTIFSYIVNQPCNTSAKDLQKMHLKHEKLMKKENSRKEEIDKSNIIYKVTE